METSLDVLRTCLWEQHLLIGKAQALKGKMHDEWYRVEADFFDGKADRDAWLAAASRYAYACQAVDDLQAAWRHNLIVYGHRVGAFKGINEWSV